MAVAGCCDVPLQGLVLITQLQLQQLGVVHLFLPLDVDGKLVFAPSALHPARPLQRRSKPGH